MFSIWRRNRRSQTPASISRNGTARLQKTLPGSPARRRRLSLLQSDPKQSGTRKLFWALVLPIAFSVLCFFLTLPLRWKDQAILGCLLIASAVSTNRFLSHRVATLSLSLSACFCTARYAYYRYSETIWNF